MTAVEKDLRGTMSSWRHRERPSSERDRETPTMRHRFFFCVLFLPKPRKLQKRDVGARQTDRPEILTFGLFSLLMYFRRYL